MILNSDNIVSLLPEQILLSVFLSMTYIFIIFAKTIFFSPIQLQAYEYDSCII